MDKIQSWYAALYMVHQGVISSLGRVEIYKISCKFRHELRQEFSINSSGEFYKNFWLASNAYDPDRDTSLTSRKESRREIKEASSKLSPTCRKIIDNLIEEFIKEDYAPAEIIP